MAVVQGVKERLHFPVFSCLKVEAEEQLREAEPTSILKFFVDVQKKTKLETNLQSAGLLPHYNTFEARALRVVFSDLPPRFPEKVEGEVTGTPESGNPDDHPLTTDLARLMELLDEARDADDGNAIVWVKDGEEVEEGGGGTKVTLGVADIEAAIDDLGNEAPPAEQLSPANGAGSIVSKFLYNTVTSLYVGEKLMISMPTWFFPAGAGPYSEGSHFTTNGEPNPTATFRFAEPVFIDKQQNFRVEIEVPDSEVHEELQKIYGPLFIWVVLDGYMTRDVQ